MSRDAHSELEVSTPALARPLRSHLAAHNLRVAGLALATLLTAAALWYALYFGVKWVALFFATAVEGTEARMPLGIDDLFWFIAAALLAVAWIDRRLRPDDRARDHKSLAEIAWEFLLLIPRLTLSIGGTLSAWQQLDRQELREAAELIARLISVRRLPLNSLPLEIPTAPRRFKILFALQLTQIIDIRREDRELWVMLDPLRPAWVGGSAAKAVGEAATLPGPRPACAP